MKIRIVNGTYGMNVNGMIIPKTNKDDPFDLDDEKAKRLLNLKVAEYVGISEDENHESINGKFDREQLNSINFFKLKSLAKDLGVSTDGKKDEIIDRILKVNVEVNPIEEDDEEDDDETPPEINAGDQVN